MSALSKPEVKLKKVNVNKKNRKFMQVFQKWMAVLLFLAVPMVYTSGQTVSVKEVALIKIVIPEKFKTDYALLVKISESETAKALDEAFALFLAKMDAVTARCIKYLIEGEPSRNTLEGMIKQRKSDNLWHPLISADLDKYYANLVLTADSLDEEGLLKPNRPRPRYPSYGNESVGRIDLDRKMLLEKNKYWHSQRPAFHELAAIEDRLNQLPKEIELAIQSVQYFERVYKAANDRAFDELPKPADLIEAEKALEALRNEETAKKAREWKIGSEIGESGKAEYQVVRTLISDDELKKLPELILTLRL